MTPKPPSRPAVPGTNRGFAGQEELQAAVARHPAVRAALARLGVAERVQARTAIGKAIAVQLPDGWAAGTKIR